MTPCLPSARYRLLVATVLLVLASSSLAPTRGAVGAPRNAEANPSLPRPGSYTLDAVHTFVYWTAQHKVVGKVRGRFDRMTGTIVVRADAAACSVDVAIESASLSTQNPIRDEDVQGPDFFDAKNFPVITYRGAGIRKSGEGWVLDGALTIRSITKTVPLQFSFRGLARAVQGKPDRVAFHASTAVQRAEFGMTRELLDEIGTRSTRPDVWIEIDSEALANAPNGH